MKVKTPDTSPIAVLYRAAQQIVDGTRAVFAKQGKDATELRLPILIHDSDMRITIEAGPRIAARNAIENARMQASGKPVEPPLDMTRALRDARALLLSATAHTPDAQRAQTLAGVLEKIESLV